MQNCSERRRFTCQSKPPIQREFSVKSSGLPCVGLELTAQDSGLRRDDELAGRKTHQF